MIMIDLKRPCRPLLELCTPSKRCVKISETRRSPVPKESAADRIKRSRRVNLRYDSTRIPEVMTLAKRNVNTPPTTGFGTVHCVKFKEVWEIFRWTYQR